MRSFRTHTYLGITTSTCPVCMNLVQAKIVAEKGKVFFEKYCPKHGESRALVSEDVEFYLHTREFARPGSIPLRFFTPVDKGCPHDCGLCPSHEQHCCHPIIEITDKCDLQCPICMANNQNHGFMARENFASIIDMLVQSEGSLENVTLSGGEPSLHPDLWGLIALAQRPEISRVSIVTNGLKIAQDEAFCRKLQEQNVYVVLQWDGFSDEAYIKLRGQKLLELKKKALKNLEAWKISTQLLFVAGKGINDAMIGDAIRFMLEKDFILSLAIQPLSFIGKGGSSFHGDELDRLTIPGVIRRIEEQTNGLLKKEDFLPLPCSNPECVSLTYLLRLDDGEYVPFPRFIEMKKYLHLWKDSATIPPNQETEEAIQEIIGDLWSSSGEIPNSKRITSALRRSILEIYPKEKKDYRDMVRASERQAKSIFIHHYMDRFNFDLARIMKCCHHYPRPNGKIMPICAFNLFHRKSEENCFGNEE